MKTDSFLRSLFDFVAKIIQSLQRRSMVVVTDPSSSSSSSSMVAEVGSEAGPSSSSSMAGTEIVAEMKKDLLKFVKGIVDVEDPPPFEAIDGANRIFSALYGFELENSIKTLESSMQNMSDPVIIASGQTYDRRTIQSWLDQGNHTCPRTGNILVNRKLTSNLLVRNILLWRHGQGIQPPEPVPNQLSSLLERLSSQSISDQEDAASQLSRLSYKEASFRALFSESKVPVSRLLVPLGRRDAKTYPNIQDHLIKCILNISSHEDNKKIIATTRGSIPLLVEYLSMGTDRQRIYTAAIFWSLAKLDSNKVIIRKSGALGYLVEVIQEGSLEMIKNAADALYGLCTNEDNMVSVIEYGAVHVVWQRIKERPVPQLLKILDLFSSNLKALTILHHMENVIKLMIRTIRLSRSEQKKEHCISVIHALCNDDHRCYAEVNEKKLREILLISSTGTFRAREKASEILARLSF